AHRGGLAVVLEHEQQALGDYRLELDQVVPAEQPQLAERRLDRGAGQVAGALGREPVERPCDARSTRALPWRGLRRRELHVRVRDVALRLDELEVSTDAGRGQHYQRKRGP